jgi:hypothetical protein
MKKTLDVVPPQCGLIESVLSDGGMSAHLWAYFGPGVMPMFGTSAPSRYMASDSRTKQVLVQQSIRQFLGKGEGESL